MLTGVQALPGITAADVESQVNIRGKTTVLQIDPPVPKVRSNWRIWLCCLVSLPLQILVTVDVHPVERTSVEENMQGLCIHVGDAAPYEIIFKVGAWELSFSPCGIRVSYDLDLDHGTWMVAGRKRGVLDIKVTRRDVSLNPNCMRLTPIM